MCKNEQVILAADNNEGDRFLIKKAFEKCNLTHKIIFAENGEELLTHLMQHRQNKILPQIILLDLNMPKLNGLETLKIIREDSEFKTIPILILSDDKTDEKIAKAYSLGANSFIQKPLGFDKFTDFIKTIDKYWFEVVTMPNNPKTDQTDPINQGS
jgi:two-component system response regulator